ncbi:MAG: VCBS repeat-containing protein, partial [Planctomycetota bacterium]
MLHRVRSLQVALLLLQPLALAQTFGPPEFVDLANRPAGLTLTDFNGDGLLDAVVALPNPGRLSLVSDVAGTRSVSAVDVGGGGPVDVAAGDLDGDGAVDLVSANRDGDSLSVLLGVGNGTFGLPALLAAPGEPTEIALADLDLDGSLDLIVGFGAGESLRLWAGQGDGTFVPANDFALEWSVLDLSVADLDGDQLPEVVASAEWAGTRILRNRGNFNFDLATGPATFGGFTASTDFADADQDGDLDIAWVEQDGLDSCIEVAPNNGNGSFPTLPGLPAFFTVDSYLRVRFAELDGDGDPDLVGMGSFGFFGSSLTWLQSRAGGPGVTFVGPINEREFDALGRDLVLADVDGDGLDDALVSDRAGSRLAVLRNLACGAGPLLLGFEPSLVETVNLPGAELDLTGCGLEGVTAATLAGQPVPFNPPLLEAPASVGLPLTLPAGPTTLTLDSPQGSTSLPIEVQPNGTPTLVLDPSPALSPGSSATVRVGVGPSELVFLGVSPFDLPSNIPGLLE